jgi:hypothetical protein
MGFLAENTMKKTIGVISNRNWFHNYCNEQGFSSQKINLFIDNNENHYINLCNKSSCCGYYFDDLIISNEINKINLHDIILNALPCLNAQLETMESNLKILTLIELRFLRFEFKGLEDIFKNEIV